MVWDGFRPLDKSVVPTMQHGAARRLVASFHSQLNIVKPGVLVEIFPGLIL